MEISPHIKRLLFKFCFIVLTLLILLWFSIFSYGLLYYLYIPAIAHVKPIHLKYDTTCFKDRLCTFPYDNISLVEKGHHELLSSSQGYAVEIVLEMPESERNFDQGMFMVQLNMLSKGGDILRSSRRPVMLRYRSRLFQVIYTLFYVAWLLVGSVEEKQFLSVPLFENYMENSHHPAHFAHIVVEAQTAEVYASTLRIHAQFTGLRYVMYYWPMLSAFTGIGLTFSFVSMMVVLIWVRHFKNSAQYINLNTLTQQEQSLVHEIRQSAKAQQNPTTSGIPSQRDVISRAEETFQSDGDDIEDISPYSDLSSTSFPPWYKPQKVIHVPEEQKKETNEDTSSGDSEFSVCLPEEQPSSEIDNIMRLSRQSKLSTSARSPGIRRRPILD